MLPVCLFFYLGKVIFKVLFDLNVIFQNALFSVHSALLWNKQKLRNVRKTDITFQTKLHYVTCIVRLQPLDLTRACKTVYEHMACVKSPPTSSAIVPKIIVVKKMIKRKTQVFYISLVKLVDFREAKIV